MSAALQTSIDERAIDRMGRVPAHDARADECVRVDVSMSEELPALRLDLREITGRERRERCGVGIDLVAEDPQMPGDQAAFFAALQAQLTGAAIVGAGTGEGEGKSRLDG